MKERFNMIEGIELLQKYSSELCIKKKEDYYILYETNKQELKDLFYKYNLTPYRETSEIRYTLVDNIGEKIEELVSDCVWDLQIKIGRTNGKPCVFIIGEYKETNIFYFNTLLELEKYLKK